MDDETQGTDGGQDAPTESEHMEDSRPAESGTAGEAAAPDVDVDVDVSSQPAESGDGGGEQGGEAPSTDGE